MANEKERPFFVMKNGSVVEFVDDMSGKLYGSNLPGAPVIYPDEEFDFPVEEDYDDTDVIGEPDKDDMVPVYPCGIAVPAMTVMTPQEMTMSAEAIDAGLRRLWRFSTADSEPRIKNFGPSDGGHRFTEVSAIIVPNTMDELEYLRRALKELPAGLKAVIYADLYNEGLRVTDVLSTDKKVGAAEKYIKEFSR